MDVDGTALRVLGADPDIDDLSDKYAQLHRQRGNDLMVGLRLERLLQRAGLEPVAFEGHYSILTAPVGVRPPSWAARNAMLAEHVASPQDVERWEAAFRRMDEDGRRPTIFVPNFFAVGRKAR